MRFVKEFQLSRLKRINGNLVYCSKFKADYINSAQDLTLGMEIYLTLLHYN